MDLIAGRWADPAQPDGALENRSPADLSVVLGTHPFAVAQVALAVEAAKEAQRGWAQRPLEERVAVVRAIGAALKQHEDELARAIALDMGKALWDARTEVSAAVGKAAVTVDEGLRLVAGFAPGAADGRQAARAGSPGYAGAVLAESVAFECRFKPLGVLAVFGPFNFPVHLPNGHILPALACGNAVVFKPSEFAPHAAEVYARCLVEAGVPPGVFNLVQGGPAVGQALATHQGVAGILFTGSGAVGEAITRATLGQPKLLALELGGKNAALALAGCDEPKAIYDALFSAFVSAGQRCTAASRLIVEGPPARADAFAERLAALARKLVVGHPLDAGVFMGPLASEAAQAKFETGLAAADADVVLASRRLEPRGLRGCYVSPAVHRVRVRAGSRYQREELFGPDLAVYSAGSLEEAVAIANDTDYGLAASVHTDSVPAFERAALLLSAGCINWNAPTVGASGRLPFGGTRKSGNHRPAGLFSTLYCAEPVALMRGEPRLDAKKLAPGVTWELP